MPMIGECRYNQDNYFFEMSRTLEDMSLSVIFFIPENELWTVLIIFLIFILFHSNFFSLKKSNLRVLEVSEVPEVSRSAEPQFSNTLFCPSQSAYVKSLMMQSHIWCQSYQQNFDLMSLFSLCSEWTFWLEIISFCDLVLKENCKPKNLGSVWLFPTDLNQINNYQ